MERKIVFVHRRLTGFPKSGIVPVWHEQLQTKFSISQLKEAGKIFSGVEMQNGLLHFQKTVLVFVMVYLDK